MALESGKHARGCRDWVSQRADCNGGGAHVKRDAGCDQTRRGQAQAGLDHIQQSARVRAYGPYYAGRQLCDHVASTGVADPRADLCLDATTYADNDAAAPGVDHHFFSTSISPSGRNIARCGLHDFTHSDASLSIDDIWLCTRGSPCGAQPG